MTEPTDHDRPADPERGPGEPARRPAFGGSPTYSGWEQPPLTELPSGAEAGDAWPGGVPAAGHQQPGHPQPGYQQFGYPHQGSPAPGQPHPGYDAGYPAGGYPPEAQHQYQGGQYQGAGYPAGGYQAGGGYPPGGYPPGGYLPPGYPVPPPRRRFRLILASVVAVLLLVVGGVAAAAYEVLNGGGTQPDAAVPASAVAFLKLDLNPSAQQKIDAARFLHRLPNIGQGFTGSTDWRKAMFAALSATGSLSPGADYNRDVKPWLGKRMAIAVLPPPSATTERQVLAVFQCTDEAKARAGIARIDPAIGVSFTKGYAIVAGSQEDAEQAVRDAKTADLASSARYRSDMKRLGGLGVFSGWFDLAGVGDATNLVGTDVMGTGRLAFTLRLRGDSADLVAKVTGGGVPSGRPAESLAGLPASTAAAASFSYDPSTISAQWKQYSELFGALTVPEQELETDPLSTFADQFDLSVPGDLTTLLGSGVRASLDGDGLGGNSPKFAVHSTTNGTAAEQVMDRMQDAAGGTLPITYRADSIGLAVGSDLSYLAAVSAPSGPKLSGVAAYRDAVPDAAGATMVLFVDFDTVRSSLAKNGANQDMLNPLEPYRSAGLTVRVEGGAPTIHLRLLAH